MKRRLFFYLVSVLSFEAFTACDSEEREPDRALSSAIVSIHTRSISTRADLSESPAQENELINGWWIAFVDKNDKVAALFKSKDGLTACSEDEVEGLLPTGNYTAYAFANVTPEELKRRTGLEFMEDSQSPKLDDIRGIKWTNLENGFSGNIPMCGWKEINVRGTVEEKFAIEVVRMLGKVEFSFANRSSKDISLKEITFGPLNTGDVVMMPDYNKLATPNSDGMKPELLSGTGTENYSYKLSENGMTLTAGVENGGRAHFYVRESVADSHPTGHFHFSLKISREGNEEELLYALTDNLTYINRNDYILIPVNFHDYSFKPEVLFYPPIGGYPPVVSEDKNDEYYIKFGTGGFFEITPRVYEDGDTELARGSYTVAFGTPSGADIFTKKPSIDTTTGEITGELSSATGTAVIPIAVTVSEDSNNVTFTRNLYIIRE